MVTRKSQRIILLVSTRIWGKLDLVTHALNPRGNKMEVGQSFPVQFSNTGPQKKRQRQGVGIGTDFSGTEKLPRLYEDLSSFLIHQETDRQTEFG